MLIPADDYPLHQTPEPLAYAGTDRNFYDRFFFNGYSAKDNVFFALALGVYPQLNIMDASFCLSVDGRQYNLRVSKEMLGDRLNLNLGPISVQIVKPMQQTQIIIAENEYGLSANLTACARHLPIEEPRFTRRHGPRMQMDVTRATQNITWQGEININGKKIATSDWYGTRDRSWGLRSIGTADPQAMVPAVQRQFYWLWTPANFNNESFFFHSNDDGAGIPWNRKAVVSSIDEQMETGYKDVSFQTQYERGNRRITDLQVKLNQNKTVSITSLPLRFYMQGLGYVHPQWNHGMHHGPLAVAFDEIDINTAEADFDNGKVENIHIQQLAEFRFSDSSQVGVGVIEQLFMGPHSPSGFNDLFDGYNL